MYRGRTATEVPETIEELKNFCYRHGLPLEQMRFFIGENYPGARAFGIYQDYDGYFVVYKNKADGTRAIRYRGTDEAYAVNEIYQKMKSEIQKQNDYRRNSGYFSGSRKRDENDQIYVSKPIVFLAGTILLVLLSAIIIGVNFSNVNRNPNGYYYEQNYYSDDDDDWGNDWSDSSWDSGSDWDSGVTDWDSDW